MALNFEKDEVPEIEMQTSELEVRINYLRSVLYKIREIRRVLESAAVNIYGSQAGTPECSEDATSQPPELPLLEELDLVSAQISEELDTLQRPLSFIELL